MLPKTITILVITIYLSSWTYGDYMEECEGILSSYIAVEENCSQYIFCQEDDSFTGDCPEDSPYFSQIDQTCDVTSSVCGTRPFENGNAPPSPSPEVTISTLAPVTTAISFNSSTPIISSTSSGSTNTQFVIPTVPSTIASTLNTNITPITSTPPRPTSSPTSSPLTPVECPAVDNLTKPMFLPNPKSCSDYFLCYHGQPLAMYCSNMLHFDMKQQKCDYPENVNCQMNLATPREQCLPHTFDVYPYPNNCNYYYLCSFGYLMVMQCPLKLGWDYEKRSCVLLQQAKCYNSLQRF